MKLNVGSDVKTVLLSKVWIVVVRQADGLHAIARVL